MLLGEVVDLHAFLSGDDIALSCVRHVEVPYDY